MTDKPYSAFRATKTLGVLVSATLLTLVSQAAWAAVPDISGPWRIKVPITTLTAADGSQPPLRPDAQALHEKNRAAKQISPDADPLNRCLPPGVPRLMAQPSPFKIIQGKRIYGMIFEWNHLNRAVYLEPAHGETIGPLYLGDSIGRWDGETFVVDTTSYNDLTWLDETGLPHSDDLHTVERLRLVNGGQTLEVRITIEDSKTFSRPWEAVLTFERAPGVLIKEDYCLGRRAAAPVKAQ
jgi:hypothetical protein